MPKNDLLSIFEFYYINTVSIQIAMIDYNRIVISLIITSKDPRIIRSDSWMR